MSKVSPMHTCSQPLFYTPSAFFIASCKWWYFSCCFWVPSLLFEDGYVYGTHYAAQDENGGLDMNLRGFQPGLFGRQMVNPSTQIFPINSYLSLFFGLKWIRPGPGLTNIGKRIESACRGGREYS